MAWRLDDLPIFMSVAEVSGISAAAAKLGLSKSAVSKALTRLEEALGVRLLERNSRNVRLTGEGEAFYRHGLRILDEVSEVNELMAGMVSEPQGKLTVAMPMAFSREILAARLPEFLSAHPALEVEIIVTSHAVDLIRDQIDLAVMVGVLDDSELVARSLYQSRLLWVASPAYYAAHQSDLQQHRFAPHIQLCEKRYAEVRLPAAGGQTGVVLRKAVPRLSLVNDPIVVREAVAAGAGISLLPDQYCKAALAQGTLRQLLPGDPSATAAASLSVVYPQRRMMSRRIRVFVDFLLAICREHHDNQTGY